jgi:hypothetical protein
MKPGDLVQVRGFTGGAVRSVLPGDPFGRGIVIQPGTSAVVIELGLIRTQVLVSGGIHWVYNEHMKVVT